MTSNPVSGMLTPVQIKKYSDAHLEETIAVTPVPQASSTVERRDPLSGECDKSIDLKMNANAPDPTRLINAVGDIQGLAECAKNYRKQSSPTRSDARSSLGLLDCSFSDFSVDGGDIKEIISKLGDISLNKGPVLPSEHEILPVSGCGSGFAEQFQSLRTDSMMSDANIDLQLRLQRALAQSVLDRSEGSSESKQQLSTNCQEPPDSGKNPMDPIESAGRSNDFPSDMLLAADRTSGCSSTQILNSGEVAKNPFSDSNVGTDEDLQLMFQEFDSEEFISADEVIDKLKADEIAWKKEFADIASCSAQGKRIDLSCFSGILGDEEISLGSSMLGAGLVTKKKVRPEEFFALKTDNIGSLHGDHLSDTERPNFGHTIKSPAQGRRRVPLVDDSTDEGTSVDCFSVSEEDDYDASMTSSPSLTAINNLLCVDSPGTIANKIMKYNPKKQGKNILKDTSNYKYGSADVIPTLPKTAERSSLKEVNVEANVTCEGNTSQLDVIESSGRIVLDSLNEYSTTTESLCSTITIDDTMDDLKENELDRHKVIDKMAQTFKKSCRSGMSYESELDRRSNKSRKGRSLQTQNQLSTKEIVNANVGREFDVDDFILLNDGSIMEQGFPTDSWVHVEVPTKELNTYIGVEVEASLLIKNVHSRWLQCLLTQENVLCREIPDVDSRTLARVQFPNQGLLEPNQHDNKKLLLKVWMTPLVVGHLTALINVRLEDIVTKATQIIPCYFQVISIVPKIAVLVNEQDNDEVDFGTLPENCSQCCTVTIINACSQDLPLNFTLQQASKCRSFFLMLPDKADVENSHCNPEKMITLSHCLSGGQDKPLHVNLVFNTPTLRQMETMTGLVDLSACLTINMDVPSPKALVLKKLQLHGCVGHTKLMISSRSPMILSARGPGERSSQVLPVKNTGLVPLTVHVKLLDSSTMLEVSDETMYTDKMELVLGPDEEGSLQLTFCPDWNVQSVLERTLLLAIQPNGEMFEVSVQGKLCTDLASGSGQTIQQLSVCTSSSDGSNVMSGRPCSLGCESSNSGRSSRSVSGKSIVTTQKQMVWGSVTVGKSQAESCSLRNELACSVKLMMTVYDPTSSYKLLNELGEAVTQRKITLHSMECLTFTVIFCPLKCGAAFGKIQFRDLSSRTNNRFAIPLYGYGGATKFTIRDVVRDKTGHMWLNLGQLDLSMHTQLTIHNKGNLDAFAMIKHVTRGIGPLVQPAVFIEPSLLIIGAGCSVPVRVNYRLQSEDLKFLTKDDREVIEVGILCITCGDEPTRHRLRRIRHSQSKSKCDKKPISDSLNLEELCLPFPGEPVLDLNILNDPESAVRFLYRTFQQHEVALTVEKFADKSFAMQTCVGAAGQSLLFKTMFDDNTTFTCGSEESELHLDGTWSITPSSLTLMVPHFVGGCIAINSNFKEDQMFEAQSSDSFLTIKPTSGIVPAMGETIVTIRCSTSLPIKCQMCKVVVKIFLENDVKSVPINIKNNSELLAGPQEVQAVNSVEGPDRAAVQRKTKRPMPLHSDNYDVVFPKTLVGSVSVAKCIIENESTRPFQVKVCNVNAPFSTPRTVIPLKEKQQAVLKLYFKPSTAVHYKQDMMLISGDYIPLSFSLSGEGVFR